MIRIMLIKIKGLHLVCLLCFAIIGYSWVVGCSESIVDQDDVLDVLHKEIVEPPSKPTSGNASSIMHAGN